MKCKNCNEKEGKPKFCSRSCSASFNNKGVRRHGKPPNKCEVCGGDTKSTRQLYCSIECSGIGRKIKNKKLKDKIDPELRRSEYLEKRRIYSKLHYRRRKKYCHEKLGGKCVVCGTTENLQIDHIDPFDKSIDISKLINRKNKFLDVELKKCQLLCKHHHIQKNKVDGSTFKNQPYGERVKQSKLTDEKVVMIRELSNDGISNTEIGKMFNVTKTTIRNAVTGKTWKHI